MDIMMDKYNVNIWREIHGFNSPYEFNKFIFLIEDMVAKKTVEEIAIDLEYSKGEIYGGRWFINKANGEKWRLVSPDFPFKGLWEKIDH